jgi:hypothetical protein
LLLVSDPKTVDLPGLLGEDVHPLDRRVRRTLPAPSYGLGDGSLRTLKNSLDRAVGAVADRSGEAETARHVACLYAKEDALHLAGDDDADADVLGHRSP